MRERIEPSLSHVTIRGGEELCIYSATLKKMVDNRTPSSRTRYGGLCVEQRICNLERHECEKGGHEQLVRERANQKR